ncbi:MAG TPA: hypothetical protein P5279_02260 [Anaerohalosphaeraceae bacterium]|jgi:hypothetical protein|nr:hypothetical protein [Anaerohalosphaeraceae bacterium]HRT49292.1 hypothetical protein [Anaerohalosphaeraceae bacterium]HRT85169.1 hypothetical protein [Anaerohalosphaeraceae bacterium]
MKRIVWLSGAAVLASLGITCSRAGAPELYRMDRAVVEYENIDAKYAEAMCKTASTASDVCRELGFDMPQTVRMSAVCDAAQPVRLYCDGNDRIYLTVRSEKNLAGPAESGIHNVYGICHEVGHLAMYRLVPEHMWLSSAGAEGWAHFLGSRIVDRVWKAHGKGLWPDGHDYSADGTARLTAQLGAAGQSATVKGAGLWQDLAALMEVKQIAAVFGAWSKAKIDMTDPGAGLRAALLAVNNDPRTAAWWNKAEPVFVVRQPKSGFAARTAMANELQGKAIELALDDGRQADKKSIAGGGHAVKYTVGGEGWYLTGVRIFGSRYGMPQAPQEDFHVWLCDADLNVIADFPQPYGKFRRGEPTWVNLLTRPTNVPREFVICVGFNPTATKGVYVGMDGTAGKGSMAALPGRDGRVMDEGNWMIRARVDQLKSADALTLADQNATL